MIDTLTIQSSMYHMNINVRTEMFSLYFIDKNRITQPGTQQEDVGEAQQNDFLYC